MLLLLLPGAAGWASQADFAPVSRLVEDAIAAGKLPGAVVIVGQNNHVVFHRAYGMRKLPGEPGLGGAHTPGEPMTENTVFDMASLTKVLATTTAVLQLYEAGKVSLDAPLEEYLPAFNPAHDPVRARVTVRLLLTHFSGEPPDISIADPWGLQGLSDVRAVPDARVEGLRRALSAPLALSPGSEFRYSDINFLLLGLLVETLSGEREDRYVEQHVLKPLRMRHTRFLPLDTGCGEPYAGVSGEWRSRCTRAQWSYRKWLPRTAPTAHDDDGTAATNADYGRLLRGVVHDPTARRMGGVAGHAGLFATAGDTARFVQALLQKLTRNTGPFPLRQATLQLATTPQQPGHSEAQLIAAAQATRGQASAADPLLAPLYPAIAGQTLRGLGWDIDSAFSKPRGRVFAVGSFGHTGFTGTSVWMDPGSDTYVVLLANAVHPRVGAAISALRGDVASAAALALHVQ